MKQSQVNRALTANLLWKPCLCLCFPFKVPSIGFRDVDSLEVCESDIEAVLIVTSDGVNPEPVEVGFMFVAGTAQGNLYIRTCTHC